MPTMTISPAASPIRLNTTWNSVNAAIDNPSIIAASSGRLCSPLQSRVPQDLKAPAGLISRCIVSSGDAHEKIAAVVARVVFTGFLRSAVSLRCGDAERGIAFGSVRHRRQPRGGPGSKTVGQGSQAARLRQSIVGPDCRD